MSPISAAAKTMNGSGIFLPVQKIASVAVITPTLNKSGVQLSPKIVRRPSTTTAALIAPMAAKS